ncbi:TPA: hypothetical protein HIT55_001496 [Escherichia fergusonii]|nr:hypothetical protein [Escherichia fergusonii]PQI94561.1 hypothetical protein C5U38_20250 [Escherichia fergusonii]QMG51502.1 hypothetical protein HVY57_20385 [Escherichia fergusonii]HAI1313969.1 hypothetical protein [Escherichia fergusonii]
MQWKIINGWYCVTACGFMSWKFRTLQEGIKWAFVSKEARDVANDTGTKPQMVIAVPVLNIRL